MRIHNSVLPKSEPQTDLQSRLRFIQDQCSDLQKSAADPYLCYLVQYLASILETHLKTGEQ